MKGSTRGEMPLREETLAIRFGRLQAIPLAVVKRDEALPLPRAR